MKILLVNSFDKTGGSTIRMRRFYKFLCELGYDVIYVESNSDLREQNVISIKQQNTSIGFLVGTLKRIILVLKIKYDILFIQKLVPFTVPIIFIAKLFNKKIIDDFDDWDSLLQKSFVMKYLCSLSENLFYNFPDVYITPHKYLRTLLQKKTNKKIYIIPQGIDTELFNPNKYDKYELRKIFNIPLDSKIIGFVGCFTPAGVGEFEKILLSVKKIIDNDKNVYFLVIGGGRLLDYYKDFCNKIGIKNVIFTYTLQHNEIPKYIAVCDVMTIWMRDLIGDYFKGTLKIIEYLCMNKPVVGVLVGETEDSFGKYCIKSLPTVEYFVKCLYKALSEDTTKQYLFYNFIKENYSFETGKNLLQKIIEEVIK